MFYLFPKSSKKHLLTCYKHKPAKLRLNQKFSKANFSATSNQESTNADKVVNTLKSEPQKAETEKSDVFLERATKLKAGFLEGQISIDWRSTTRTNSQLFRYDYWKWIVDFTDKISHRNELNEAQCKMEQLKNALVNIRYAKKNLENEIDEIRYKAEKYAILHDSSSPDHQQLSAQDNSLKELEQNLVTNLKDLNVQEEDNFQQFLLAIADCNAKEDFHTRFLKAAILFGIVFTLILTSTAFYIHNFNLVSDLKKQAATIRELQTQMFGKKSSAANQQSWTSYLTSWFYTKK